MGERPGAHELRGSREKRYVSLLSDVSLRGAEGECVGGKRYVSPFISRSATSRSPHNTSAFLVN